MMNESVNAMGSQPQGAANSGADALATLDTGLARNNWQRYLYGKDRSHLEYMEKAQRNEGMYLGDGKQWSDADKAILEDEGRPFYELNQIMPSVNAALGYQIQNRLDIAFRPRGGKADQQTANVINKLIRQVCDQNKLHWKETCVYSDGLIEQRGYYDIRMDFNHNMLGDIAIGVDDPMDVIPDPDAKSYDPDDWADVIVTRWLNADEIEQRYGRDARDLAESTHDWGPDFGEVDNETERSKFAAGAENRIIPTMYDAYTNEQGLKRYRLIDRQFWVFEMTPCIVFPETGDISTMAAMTQDQVADALAKGAVVAKRMRRRVRWVVSTYTATVHDSYSPYEHFTTVPYFCYFRRGQTRGMVDNAIGPQQVINKGISQFVAIVNTSANSGWTVEENSLSNMDTDELESDGARTGLVIEFKQGMQRPEKIQPNTVPTGIDRLIELGTQTLKDVTVPDAMRGLQGTAISGVAKRADQFSSQQMLAVPQDNLKYTRELVAGRLLKLCQRYYDSPRVLKITEIDPLTGKPETSDLAINQPDEQNPGQYLNDITIGTYDVVVSVQPTTTTFDDSQFDQIMEMKEKGINIPDTTVVRYSKLPDKYELMAAMQPTPTDPTLQAKADLLVAQAAKTKADTVNARVTSLFSGTQAAQVLATIPQMAPIADAMLLSAGFEDQNAAPIIPAVPAGVSPGPALPQNTDPLTPLKPTSPAIGMNRGIETQRPDSVGVAQPPTIQNR